MHILFYIFIDNIMECMSFIEQYYKLYINITSFKFENNFKLYANIIQNYIFKSINKKNIIMIIHVI